MKYKILRENNVSDPQGLINSIAPILGLSPKQLTDGLLSGGMDKNILYTQLKTTDNPIKSIAEILPQHFPGKERLTSLIPIFNKGELGIKDLTSGAKKIFEKISNSSLAQQAKSFQNSDLGKMVRNEIHKSSPTGVSEKFNNFTQEWKYWSPSDYITKFPTWVSMQFGRLYNDENDSIVKVIRTIFPKNTADNVLSKMRSVTMNNPNIIGTSEGAAAGSSLFGIGKYIMNLLGITQNETEKAAELAQAQSSGMTNGLMYGAAAASIGAGLLWLYNKFKSNPRRQLSPQEIAYAMKLNQQTPNQGNNQ